MYVYIYIFIIYPSSQINFWLVLCLGHRVRFTLGPYDASCTLVSAPRGAAVPGLPGGHGEVLGDHSAMCGATAGGTSEAAGGEGKICGEMPPGLPGCLGEDLDEFADFFPIV